MNPIRILHLTPPGFGGIDSYIFGHYRHMDQQRFRFDFMTQNLELENAEQYQDFSWDTEKERRRNWHKQTGHGRPDRGQVFRAVSVFYATSHK